ncbi:MAG: hypothetical protein M0R74_02270 [Dehalococcoidia bacterium]|nr:hypothetical protein [Dehalococcoidia bacterium]
MSTVRRPYQNRVTPFGEVVATEARGLFLGNRGGRFHDNETRALTRRRWASRQWICCLLEFRSRRMEVFGPNRYTQLFFLDEATALAAGHRPCFECRRADANRFRTAFVAGNPGLALAANVPAPELDRILHSQRLLPDGGKRTFAADANTLPEGTMVTFLPERDAWLAWGGELHRWAPGGYCDRMPLHAGPCTVLTPPAVVGALRAGYVPVVHPSAATR